jgi:ribosome-binding protein aMBF1 (putative translation factor)
MRIQLVIALGGVMFQFKNTKEDHYPINRVSGEMLKKRRVLLGLSQNTLAKIIGVHNSDIKRYENETTIDNQSYNAPLLHSIMSFFVI